MRTDLGGASPLSQPRFWAALDERIAAAVRRRATTIRGVLRGLSTGSAAPVATFAARSGETAIDVEVASPFGLTSSPPADVEVVAAAVGGSSAHLVVIGQIDRVARPQDLEPGETRVYCTSAGTQIRVRPSGAVEIATASGASVTLDASGAVVLNGGTAGVARLGDACAPSAGMTAWISAVSGALATLTGGAFPPPADATYAVAVASTTVRSG